VIDLSHIPQPSTRYGAMTVNERLFSAGLRDQFDAAARSRDRRRMIALLVAVEIADEASRIVDTVIANPAKYDY
jgi:hypothetical protein